MNNTLFIEPKALIEKLDNSIEIDDELLHHLELEEDKDTQNYKNNQYIQTTIGQLNFFKWALENDVIDYIKNHYREIEQDMNNRNSTSKRKNSMTNKKTRKKREELSISASKTVHREEVEIVVKFD